MYFLTQSPTTPLLSVLTEQCEDCIHNGNPTEILLPIALLLIVGKILALFFGKIKVPQVVGFLLSGLIVGAIYLIPGQNILNDYTAAGLKVFSKIAVILIMFSAGVETDIKKLKSVGVASFFIALLGVLVPMFLCFGVAHGINSLPSHPLTIEGVNPIATEIFYGVILTATSVSITVATLKEIGKYNSRVGSALTSAAIIDDVMGIIVLSLVISLSGSSSADGSTPTTIAGFITQSANITNSAAVVSLQVLFMAIFFALIFVSGIYLRKLFNWLGNKYPHHIRIPILSLGVCFLFSYLAEWFNIADITGAYLIGLILSTTSDSHYIDHRAETTGNHLFAPIFFGAIAMDMYQSNFDFTNPTFRMFAIFGLLWILVGILGKIIGCSGAALCFKFKFSESLKVGFGMMARAEVLIVCASKGVEAGLVSNQIMPFCLLLILVTSFLTPIMLKVLYRHDDKVLALNQGADNSNDNTENN